MIFVVRTSGGVVSYFADGDKAIAFAGEAHRAGRNGVTVHAESIEYNFSEFVAGFYNRA